jgi:hypothetical protein
MLNKPNNAATTTGKAVKKEGIFIYTGARVTVTVLMHAKRQWTRMNVFVTVFNQLSYPKNILKHYSDIKARE